jgi:DNA-binding PadR family transcriptional regulator
MTDASDLTDFQKKILTILYQSPDYGLGLKRTLEDYYNEEIHHSRLYQNLDGLVEDGFVEKSKLDDRTNEYVITQEGMGVVEAETEWMRERVEV